MRNRSGGQAFPKSGYAPCGNGSAYGMTLRDYFAAKAMQGFSAHPAYGAYSAKIIASMAYDQADEMLSAREAK